MTGGFLYDTICKQAQRGTNVLVRSQDGDGIVGPVCHNNDIANRVRE
jgi:hypothetical protein